MFFLVCFNVILPLTSPHSIDSLTLSSCSPSPAQTGDRAARGSSQQGSPVHPESSSEAARRDSCLGQEGHPKPRCVFFTAPFWPARVFCMAEHCCVALKLCVRPRQKTKDSTGVKLVWREGRQKTHGKDTAERLVPTWHSFLRQLSWRACFSTRSEHKSQSALVYMPCSYLGTPLQGEKSGSVDVRKVL